MFKIIALELLPAKIDQIAKETFQNINDKSEREWAETGKAERYECVNRTFSDGKNHVFQFYKGYKIKKDGLISKDKDFGYERYFCEGGNTNISVSAIVGENGSGKSTILDIIIRMMNNVAIALSKCLNKDDSKRLLFAECVFARLYIENECGSFTVIEQNDNIIELKNGVTGKCLWSFNNSKPEEGALKKDGNELNLNECRDYLSNLFYTISINYSSYAYNVYDYRPEWYDNDEQRVFKEHDLNAMYNSNRDNRTDEQSCWIGLLFHKNDQYQIPVVLNPFREGGNIDYNNEKELLNERVYSLVFSKNNPMDLYLIGKKPYSYIFNTTQNYMPTSRRLFYSYKVGIAIQDLRNFVIQIEGKSENEIDVDIDNLGRTIIDAYNKCFNFVLVPDLEQLQVEKKNDMLRAVNYIVYKTIKITYTYSDYRQFASKLLRCDAGTILRLVRKIYNDSSHVSLKLRRTLAWIIFQHYGTNMTNSDGNRTNEITLKDLNNTIDTKLSDQSNIIEEKIHKFPVADGEPLEKHEWKEEELYPAPFLKDTLVFMNKFGKRERYDMFSSGGKQMISALCTIIYHLHQLDSVSGENKVIYHQTNVMFDELELYFHPKYQKMLVSEVIDSIKQIRFQHIRSLNLIYVTHSPFLLSDIPESNLLFLPIDKTNEIKTLGANIYDLLKNNFFLDSSVGDLIQKKLKKILTVFHEKGRKQKRDYLSNIDEFKYVIDNLGEPYLKKIFGNMIKELDAKYLDDDKVKTSLEEERERMQRRISEIDRQMNK